MLPRVLLWASCVAGARGFWENATGTGDLQIRTEDTALHRERGSGARCFAVCLHGLPRTFVRKKVVDGWRRNMIDRLGGCVDTMFVLGLQGQYSGAYNSPADSVDGWEDLRTALTVLRPIAVRHVGPAGRQVRGMGEKRRVCLTMINALQHTAMRQYDWLVLARPDLLLHTPVPTAIFEQRKVWWRYLDFLEIATPATLYRRQPRIEGHLTPRWRVCRFSGEFQRRRDGADQLWQHLWPLVSEKRPGWVNKMAPLGQSPLQNGMLMQPEDITRVLFRAFAVYCFRQQQEVDLDIHCKSYPRDFFRQLHMAAVRNDRGLLNQLVPPLTRLLGNTIDSTMSWEQGSNQIYALMCTCKRFMQRTALMPPERSPMLAGGYDHSSLECNDSITDEEAIEARQDIVEGALTRLHASLTIPGLTKVHLYTELALFCDIYRYQSDFLTPEQWPDVPKYLLKSLRKRLDALTSNSRITPFDQELKVMYKHTLRVLDGVATEVVTRDLCRVVALVDWFRMASDLYVHSTLNFTVAEPEPSLPANGTEENE